MSRCIKIITTIIGYLIILTHKYTQTTSPYKLKYPINFGNRIFVPKDNPTTKEGAYLDRLLFFEPLLSANNKISCSSCHEQKRAFTDGKAFSVGVDGTLTSRNSMALINLLWARKLFWDGRTEGLEAEAAFPLTDLHEMGQSLTVSSEKLKHTQSYPALFKTAFGDTAITPDRITKAISQFERTLISANSQYDKYLSNKYQPTILEMNGIALFNTNCSHCHGGAKTYMELFHNNGLDDVSKDKGRQAITNMDSDHGRFKTPTLRNIALTGPYMHDGRFNTLEQVLDHYSNHLQQKHLSPFLKERTNQKNGTSIQLSQYEKKAVIAFLNMLTDTSFINNPEFSNPNKSILTN